MKYQVLESFKVKTSQDEMDLQPGQVITLSKDLVIRLLNEGKIKPLADIMTEKYQGLTEWLHNHDLTGDEIKDIMPILYQNIQDAIERLDEAFVNEDLTAFQDALNKIRLLYTEAMLRCGRKIAVRVYSEILQAYLWVVDTDEDMHSLRGQGVTEAVYTKDEIKKLKGMDKESLRDIHKVKTVFECSKVEEVKRNEN